jgi:DNA-binding NarL/FixJ family response regulator
LAAELGQLTDREREVMALVAEGLFNDEIARRPFVSPATAKTHGQPGHGQARGPRPG